MELLQGRERACQQLRPIQGGARHAVAHARERIYAARVRRYTIPGEVGLGPECGRVSAVREHEIVSAVTKLFDHSPPRALP